ncbi:uncharacterized protein LOC120416375 [Culex pipiens pallens]|uniref:uncharacterized protein LOC120416375 n=1 Tax=Culex pipiens pallens TaxID=42434 RepID=UPI0022AAC736|nr:uncharacterized protein LOC120416375 [Culex pipiens pallens]
MESWKLFLVLSLTVGAVACLDLEDSAPRPLIVCHVSIYPDISDAIKEKLDDCDHVIVSYDGLCDLAKYFVNFSDTIRIGLIRSRATHANILRQVEVKFDENFDPILAVQNVQASLAGGLFDGVELVSDLVHLDQQGQIKYAKFLKILKQNLDDHVLISNSFVCNQQLHAYLLNAMSEVLDYVILLPSSQNASIEVSAFEPRVYSGPVCELQEEQQQHCEEQQNQDCSLFEDGVKLIYDDSNSAGRRALQCVGCKLKGVSIALSYDDPAGICVGSRFPLLSAVQNVFEYRSGVLGFNGCPSDSEESDVGSNPEIQFDISSHSIENYHLDSEKEGDCSCVQGALCNGCTLRKRLQQTLKSSENVASLSKDVTEKVLGSLDRVVTLVSLMMQYR